MEYLLLISGIIIGIIIGYLLFKRKTKKAIESILKNEKKSYYSKVNTRSPNYLDLIEVLKNRKDLYKNKSIEVNLLDQKTHKPVERKTKGDMEQAENYYAKIAEKISKKFPHILKEIHEFEEQNSQNINDEQLNTNKEQTASKNHSLRIDEASNSSDQSNIDLQETNMSKKTSFYSIPQKDGSFKFDAGSKLKNEDTFYKIEYDNDDIGNLDFISGELDIRAIDRVDSYLLPVCEIENIENRENANKIESVSPGKVIKKDNSWVIDPDYKVKIKFS